MPVTEAPLDVHTASQHLWEAFSHHQITMDVSAQDPVVLAVSAHTGPAVETSAERTCDVVQAGWR